MDEITDSATIEFDDRKEPMIEQDICMNEEKIQILIDSDNEEKEEEELTSSGISEDDDDNISNEKNSDEGNTLQSFDSSTDQNVSITLIQMNGVLEATQINNDHIIAQTMAVLATKYRHSKAYNSISSESEILSFIGPCPLYSLSSSFGLDMQHGLCHFPCRDVLAGGGSHLLVRPLWQHLTSSHNLNLSSSTVLISHLLLHGYSSPSPILFHVDETQNILRTTPRYSLVKKCPLTRYGVYGIEFEHGTRLCSGYTYNTNIYSHLISFHRMTDDAALRLSRTIAFHEKSFHFQSNEILVHEYSKYSRIKTPRSEQTTRLFPKLSRHKPVTNAFH